MAGPTTTFQTGIHSARPAANAGCVLYSCTTHSLVYRSDGSAWTTWATIVATGMSDPMTTRGDIIYRDASNVTNRLGVGAAKTTVVSDGTDRSVTHLPGTLLGVTCYGNASDTKTTTSTSLADADATNLQVVFTAPASGNILVRLTAVASGDVGAGGLVGDIYYWGIRESSSNLVDAAIVTRLPVAGATINLYNSYSIAFKFTGVSAGSHTYKWAHKVSNSRTTGSVVTQAVSPATMEVIAL